jgi:hypothetical protein
MHRAALLTIDGPQSAVLCLIRQTVQPQDIAHVRQTLYEYQVRQIPCMKHWVRKVCNKRWYSQLFRDESRMISDMPIIIRTFRTPL